MYRWWWAARLQRAAEQLEREVKGQGLVEYALILVLVVLVVMLLVTFLGPWTGNVFSNVINNL
jgi:pilus assembly protein Flp/PilA